MVEAFLGTEADEQELPVISCPHDGPEKGLG
jgi:hypothetical protein